MPVLFGAIELLMTANRPEQYFNAAGNLAMTQFERRCDEGVMTSVLPRLLSRFGLLLPLINSWEFMSTLSAERGTSSPDGSPLPPPDLRMRVVGTAEVAWFLERGRLAEECIRAALARAGAPLGGGQAILDFGCGCGCVLRRWRRLDARVYGTDINSRAIKWCRANLPFVEVGVNALAPPLRYADASCDFVYALSVFTHLPVETQLAWRDELRRVVRPGGHLLLTLHGEAFTDGLTPEERAVYEFRRVRRALGGGRWRKPVHDFPFAGFRA